jgi:prevent-host-death family protein
LRNSANEISQFCRATREPVFITRNGVGDMVIMSVETFERREAQLELYTKLAEAEAEAARGESGLEFSGFAAAMRKKVHGKI